jgi:hypothetical protein
MGTMVSFPEVKWQGRDVDYTPTSSTEVKERVRAIPLRLSPPPRFLMACSMVNFIFLPKESIEAPGGSRNPIDVGSCDWERSGFSLSIRVNEHLTP